MTELLAAVTLQDLLGLIARHGDAVYLIAFTFAFARTGFLPPLLAGYAANQGSLDGTLTFAVFCAGSWLGDELRFFIGRRWGHALVARVQMLRRPVEVVLRVLDAFPTGFIITYRFARGMRTAAALALGMTAIAQARFTPANFLGAALWAAVFTGGGYALGHISEAALGQAANTATLALLAVFVLAGWLIARRVPALR
jgi:membrane protein DedA with SNARE-associated domain